jgi:hypothetical protein
VANIGLPAVNSEMGAMAAPAMALDGGMHLAGDAGLGGAQINVPVHSLISTDAMYEATRILRPIIEEVIREQKKK